MSLTETKPQPAKASHNSSAMVQISVDGHIIAATEGELLIEAILRDKEIPHICYHSPLMGPIETCDTCLVEVGGKLVRSCGTTVSANMQAVVTDSTRAKDARAEAYDVILGNHMLYCTVRLSIRNSRVSSSIGHPSGSLAPQVCGGRSTALSDG